VGSSTLHARMAAVLVALAAPSILSCTRMPTAPEPVILVEGRILDSRGGTISDVLVSFQGVGARSGYGTNANTAGRYHISLAPGEYDVWFAIGHVVYPGGEKVVVSPKNTKMDFTLEGFHIRGMVLDAAGGRGERLHVGVSGPVFSGWDSDVIDGAYSLFIPGGTYNLDVTGEDYQVLFTTPNVSVHADTTIDVHLDRFPVGGTVTGADGKADRGAHVVTSEVYGEADATGRYLLYLPPGETRIRCFSQNPEVLGRTVGPLTIVGPTSVDFDLRGIRWEGTVRRQETNEAAVGCYAIASVGPADDRRSAVDRIEDTGEFQLILEPGISYDLEVHQSEPNLLLYHQEFVATADTTFQLYVPAVPSP
jgi:hypothetical protein